MSSSDVAHAPSDQSLFDSLCATLEAKLATKICSSLHKAVTRKVCATLKEGVHDVLNPSAEPHEPQSHGMSTRDAACIREFCPSLEDVVANAVCAALKQTMSDTVCATLKKAIHNTIQDLLESQKGAPLHVSPVEFCVCLDDVVANAVCAALKQTVNDTVCVPLKKAIMHSMHDALTWAQSGFPHDSLADVRLLYLSADYVWYPPLHTDMSDGVEACDRVVQLLADEVCTRLQKAIAETLCPWLKKQVKRTIERHVQDMQSGGAPAQHTAQKRSDLIMSGHRTAFFVVTGLIIASLFSAILIPGMLSSSPPVTMPFAPPAATADVSVVPTVTPQATDRASTPTPTVTPTVTPTPTTPAPPT